MVGRSVVERAVIRIEDTYPPEPGWLYESNIQLAALVFGQQPETPAFFEDGIVIYGGGWKARMGWAVYPVEQHPRFIKLLQS